MKPPGRLYLDLVRAALTRTLFPDRAYIPSPETPEVEFDPALRHDGRDWPTEAYTMVGSVRLAALERLCLDVLTKSIAGDFVECGVWRGGCAILMRAVLAAVGDTVRRVWCFDSFEGLPKPELAPDAGDRFWEIDYMRVPLETVAEHFVEFGLMDSQVFFVKGWFQDTLPTAYMGAIALLRLDGDMYASTRVALESLEANVSPGGYVFIDDYGAIAACRQAVDEYRAARGITAPLVPVDWTGAYWRKA